MQSLKVTPVFHKIYKALDRKVEEGDAILTDHPELELKVGDRYYRYIVNEGSSRSSKTWSIFQYFLGIILSRLNLRITVWRKQQKTCRETVYQDFLKMLRQYSKIYTNLKHNKSEAKIAYPQTASQIEFNGTDDDLKVHGLTQDFSWFNEINELESRDVFDQIDQRTAEAIIIDWNPSMNHWVDDVKMHPRAIVIHSTFLENPFAPIEVVRKIKGYEPTEENIKSKTANKYKWEVYGLGIKSEKPNKIYHGWQKISNLDFERLPYTSYFGLDFGQANPTALVECKYNDGNFYFGERLYREGHLIESLPEKLKQLGVTDYDKIVCDSASPEKIVELLETGFDASGADKGPGSVVYGISFLQKTNVFVCEDSKNIWNEYAHYEWELDRYGMPIDKPLKKNDHALDGARYIATYLQLYLEILI